MSTDPIFIAQEPPASTKYVGFYRSSKYSNDGSNTFKNQAGQDINNILIGAGTTQAQAVTTPGFLRATAAAAPTDGGLRILSLGTGNVGIGIGAWDMASGQSLIVAFEFKTDGNKPGIGANMFGGSGPGSTGIAVSMNAAGQLAVNFKDAANNQVTIGNFAGPTNALGDGQVHRFLLAVDGVAKTGTLYIDDVLQTTVSLAALTGSTKNTFNIGIGHAGNPNGSGTWDSVATSRLSAWIEFRNIHLLVTPNNTGFTNLPNIAAWFAEGANRFFQLPASLLA